MKKILGLLTLSLLTAGILAALLYFGVIPFNAPSEQAYPVRGVDVSMYQGDIDWQTLSSQGISFAFIKATEGSSHIDPQFAENFAAASETGLRIGAYHFFSYDSSGSTQADNFIATVPKIDNQLPPVIDIEFYGDKAVNLPDMETTRASLHELIDKLEAEYDVSPILYVTRRSYDLFVKDDFVENDIWIRSVFMSAALSDGRRWTFWQYSNRGRLSGYEGAEKFIDLNVFNGSVDDFAHYCLPMPSASD